MLLLETVNISRKKRREAFHSIVLQYATSNHSFHERSFRSRLTKENFLKRATYRTRSRAFCRDALRVRAQAKRPKVDEDGRGFVEIEEEKSSFSDGSCGAFSRCRDSSSFSAKEGEKETTRPHVHTYKSEMAHGSSSVETCSLRREVTAGDYVSCVNSAGKREKERERERAGRACYRDASRARGFETSSRIYTSAIVDRSARNEKINWAPGENSSRQNPMALHAFFDKTSRLGVEYFRKGGEAGGRDMNRKRNRNVRDPRAEIGRRINF
ncbi:hypothetical protein PUN28_009087 [Cardiocondyla obscurior]|uniref:Uncharacterized protein n=1 Tax=Cardiocondyla obscurior TaxID=286306 RepID=A0AAW2FQE7_9HYME